MEYDRVEQVQKGISGGGLEGAPRRRDYRHATWISPLVICSSTGLSERWTHVGGDGLVDLESMVAKPKVRGGGGQNLRRMGSLEDCALFFTFRQGRHGFFYGQGKRAATTGELPHMERGAALLQTLPQVFECFLAPGNTPTHTSTFSLKKLLTIFIRPSPCWPISRFLQYVREVLVLWNKAILVYNENIFVGRKWAHFREFWRLTYIIWSRRRFISVCAHSSLLRSKVECRSICTKEHLQQLNFTLLANHS